MQRERRYTVIKHTDAERLLSDAQRQALCDIEAAINSGRQQQGRGLLTAAVVESDWPEYEPTWQAIERRVDNALCGDDAADGCRP